MNAPPCRATHEVAGSDTGNDPFHDPVMIGIGIAVIVVTIMILALGGLYYWGTLYDTPSWSAHSFPPPVSY